MASTRPSRAQSPIFPDFYTVPDAVTDPLRPRREDFEGYVPEADDDELNGADPEVEPAGTAENEEAQDDRGPDEGPVAAKADLKSGVESAGEGLEFKAEEDASTVQPEAGKDGQEGSAEEADPSDRTQDKQRYAVFFINHTHS